MAVRVTESQLVRTARAVAAAKLVVIGAAFGVALVTTPLQGGAVPLWVRALLVAAFGISGAAMAFWGGPDRRSEEFGVYLLLVATAFSDALGRRGHPLGGVTAFALAVHIDALTPFCFWLFVRDFPARAPFGWPFVLPERAARVSLAVGAVLLSLNAAVDSHLLSGAAARLVSPAHAPNVYWPVLLLLTIPGAPVLLLRARRVGPGDRRRILVFVLAVVAGLLPISFDILLRAISPGWNRLMADPAVNAAVMGVALAALISVPVSTAYAVVVARVADLRLIVRAALRYALARYSVLLLVGLPFIGLAWLTYRNRLSTVQELIVSPFSLIIAAGVALTIVALRVRQSAVRAIDRRFFREQYDARQILTGLVDASRRADSTEHVAELLGREIDRALHVSRLVVCVRDDGAGIFVARDGRARPLPAESVLVRLLGAADDPLDVDPEDPRSVLRRLDETERAWLADGDFRLLVPLRAADGVAIGIIGLGEKRSELPYSPDDRTLLAAVGAAGGMYLEHRRAMPTPSPARGAAMVRAAAAGGAAHECRVCGLVYATDTTACTCGAPLVVAPLPKMLADKFIVERRIGAGGMGVVYRATDVALGRAVAIKTLPRTSTEQTWRLRREARAMAFVAHANLAVIYGAESWNGSPLIVEEFLTGGTLADRLTHGPLPTEAALALGITLARALDVIHSAGLLHRDLKPTNVGYTGDGVVKVLDFGLAQLLTAAPDRSGSGLAGDATTRPFGALEDATNRAIGTPAYMSPESLRGDAPSIAVDLWSLAVLLFEAMAGVNPFRGGGVLDILDRVRQSDNVSLEQYLPGCRPELSSLFAAALASDRRKRPASAAEFDRRLSALLTRA